MKNEMHELLKEKFRTLVIRMGDLLRLTQKEMANRLVMSESSYSDIETGKAMCGTLTAILRLQPQDDPNTNLHQLQDQFDNNMKRRCKQYDGHLWNY